MAFIKREKKTNIKSKLLSWIRIRESLYSIKKFQSRKITYSDEGGYDKKTVQAPSFNHVINKENSYL